MVFGGFKYFRQMSLAQPLMRISSCFTAMSACSLSPFFLGILKPLVVLDGKLGIDRKQNDFRPIFVTPRKLDVHPRFFAARKER